MMWDDLFAIYPQSLKQIPRDIVMCMWCYDFNATSAVDHISRNRLLHDPYEEYDRLGFDYLTCPAAIYPQNILCQTRLANKHKPLGGIVTQWEKSIRFYQASYPMIALAGMLWNSNKNDDAKLIDEALKKTGISDSGVRAALAAAMTLKQRYTAGRNAACFLGDVAHVEEERLGALELILAQIGKYVSDEKNPVLQDMALTAWEGQIQRRIRKYYFETALKQFQPQDAAPSACVKTLLADLAKFRDLRLRQWKRFRPGVPSAKFEKHFADMIDDVKSLEAGLKRKTHLLKLRLFLPEMYCTPFLTIKVDGLILKENVQLKPIGEETPYYTYFLPFSGKSAPRKIEIAYKGCGGMGVTYASVVTRSDAYVPTAIGDCVGRVQNPQALLSENQQWCYLGEHESSQMFFWNELRKATSSVELLLSKK